MSASVKAPSCVKPAASVKPAADADSAGTAMAATAARKHWRSSDRNNHGNRRN
jgi:hypothetical protein